MIDINDRRYYEYGTPEKEERTRMRLIIINKCGMSEVGIAEFGVKGVMSGLYIERVWSDSDKVFADYIEWAFNLIKNKTQNKMENEITLTAYNVKTKQKNVPILNAVIKKTKKGAYMAQGVAEDGAKLVTLMSKEKADAVVKAGLAVFAPEETKE